MLAFESKYHHDVYVVSGWKLGGSIEPILVNAWQGGPAEGVAYLQVAVSADAKLLDVLLLCSTDQKLNALALEAIRKADYRPTLDQGRPVADSFRVSVQIK